MKASELTRKVYIDMDGVLVACDKAVAKYNGITVQYLLSQPHDNPYWKHAFSTGNVAKLFADMEWESNGKKLLNFFIERGIPFTFLTRPIKPPQDQDCIKGKLQWLMKNGLSKIPVLFEYNKEKYAGDGNILIDDQEGNINKWIDSGGIGILYSNDKCDEILEQLKSLL